MFKDYYKILGVKRDTDLKEIKKRYRKLALKYHPDQNDSEEAAKKFIEATEAYEVLRSSEKRRVYDRLYNQYYSKSSEKETINDTEEEFKQQKWTKYGREKAKEYSSIPIEELAKKILKEIKIGTSYIPNFVAIAIIVIGIFGMFSILPDIVEDNPGAIVFILLFIGFLGYIALRLFRVAKSDYLQDREHKL